MTFFMYKETIPTKTTRGCVKKHSLWSKSLNRPIVNHKLVNLPIDNHKFILICSTIYSTSSSVTQGPLGKQSPVLNNDSLTPFT